MTTTKKPQTERVCECGHSASQHALEPSRDEILECLFVINSHTTFCPCPAFTPKKEEKR